MPEDRRLWGFNVSESEFNPHETELNPIRRSRRLAAGADQERCFLRAWAGRSPSARQLVRAEPATTPPEIRGARDAQPASLAEPARACQPARSGDRWNPSAGPHRSNRSGTAHLIAGCVRTRAHADVRAHRSSRRFRKRRSLTRLAARSPVRSACGWLISAQKPHTCLNDP
jgi:hypothetical protein